MSGESKQAKFTIVLGDETSAPAKTAGRALADLRKKIEADQRALRGMQGALARMKAGQMSGTAEFRRLQQAITQQKARIAGAERQFASLGGTFGDTSDGARGLIGQITSLSSAIHPAVAGILGLITAYAAMVGAIGAAAVALGRYALAQADARRSELLHLEGLTTIRRYFRLAAGTGAELQGVIDRVADSSALGRGELTRYTEQLYRMGLRGQALESALEGVSTVAATQGDAMASRFAGMYAGLVRTGGGVERLSGQIRARLGGLASRQALSLSRQFERLHESVSRIFGDVRIEGFLHALHEVVSLFSQSTETGAALHEIVTDLFSPIFDAIGGGTPLVRRFFQGMILMALQLSLGILRVRHWFARTFGGGSTHGVDAMTQAINAGRFAMFGLAAALAVVAVPLVFLGLAAYGTYLRFQQYANLFTSLANIITRTVPAWATAGTAMVDGLLRSLQQGYDRVRAMVRGLADVATDTFRTSLGIHSPSRVFAQLGAQVPRGFAAGVDAGASSASDAVGDMASGATASAPSAPRGLARGATAVSFGDVHVHLASGGAGEARDAARALVEEIGRLLEGSAIELGAG